MKFTFFEFIICAVILLLVGVIVVKPIMMLGTVEYATITVTDKERIVEGYGSSTHSKYLVFTEDEVFRNTDSLIFGKFGSSDIQGQLKIGETYDVKVAGWRVRWLSWYRNILEVK